LKQNKKNVREKGKRGEGDKMARRKRGKKESIVSSTGSATTDLARMIEESKKKKREPVEVPRPERSVPEKVSIVVQIARAEIKREESERAEILARIEKKRPRKKRAPRARTYQEEVNIEQGRMGVERKVREAQEEKKPELGSFEALHRLVRKKQEEKALLAEPALRESEIAIMTEETERARMARLERKMREKEEAQKAELKQIKRVASKLPTYIKEKQVNQVFYLLDKNISHYYIIRDAKKSGLKYNDVWLIAEQWIKSNPLKAKENNYFIIENERTKVLKDAIEIQSKKTDIKALSALERACEGKTISYETIRQARNRKLDLLKQEDIKRLQELKNWERGRHRKKSD